MPITDSLVQDALASEEKRGTDVSGKKLLQLTSEKYKKLLMPLHCEEEWSQLVRCGPTSELAK